MIPASYEASYALSAARRVRRGPVSKDSSVVFSAENKRVLIADDNRDWADGLAILLADQGFSVRAAYDGRDAIEAAREFQPHVVILDVWMPRMSGFEAGRIFRGHPSGTRPLMIALTGWPEESGRTRAEEVGFDYYLGKSADSAELLGLLKRLWP
jgi:DNA-binding response OmpR family regulator